MEIEILNRKVKKELITSVPLLLLAIAISIMSWHGFFQYDDKVEIWFQRSGSIMVLFAIWVEFKLFTINTLCNPVSRDGKTWDDLEKSDTLQRKYDYVHKILKYIAAVIAVSGTLIWGYGDIFRHLTN